MGTALVLWALGHPSAEARVQCIFVTTCACCLIKVRINGAFAPLDKISEGGTEAIAFLPSDGWLHEGHHISPNEAKTHSQRATILA